MSRHQKMDIFFVLKTRNVDIGLK